MREPLPNFVAELSCVDTTVGVEIEQVGARLFVVETAAPVGFVFGDDLAGVFGD